MRSRSQLKTCHISDTRVKQILQNEFKCDPSYNKIQKIYVNVYIDRLLKIFTFYRVNVYLCVIIKQLSSNGRILTVAAIQVAKVLAAIFLSCCCWQDDLLTLKKCRFCFVC